MTKANYRVPTKNLILMIRQRILVPVDVDAQSDSALDFARTVATRLNAMISCLYVIDEQRLHVSRQTSREARQKLRREAENKLSEKVHSALRDSKTPFELIVTSGKVHEKILEKSVELNAQLIILSKSNTGDHRKKRIGSGTKYILTNARIPVISLGRNRIVNRENIIVPLDLFKPIGSQVVCAIDTAMLLGAAVTVISVIEKEKLSLRPVYLKRLKEIRLVLRDIKIDCNSLLLTAQESVADEILSFSRKSDSAILLVQTNTSTKAKDPAIGSVASELILKSGIPVQCINPNFECRKLVDESGEFIKASSLSWFSLKDHLINNEQELEV